MQYDVGQSASAYPAHPPHVHAYMQEQAERLSTPYTFRADRPTILSPALNPVTPVAKGQPLFVQYIGTADAASLNTPTCTTHQVRVVWVWASSST
jgi:hypothetical protein